ncbi:IS1 family transposase [Devosia sp. MC521]|uniref:IS1 family transposase n=2 Tax=Devosia sp. MC521 TaxID=2759954 RepID=UPI0015F95BE9|nr:IS1 family transposase [Devosia sp. MC521]QMW62569.1 IS1 family transposase [Devosia sp. MC521]
MNCPDCSSTATVKRGLKAGYQRFSCKECGRYFTDRAPKFSAQTKAQAVQMYLNGTGIRAIGRVLSASPAAVLKWIRKEHDILQERIAAQRGTPASGPDIIEMDEIYTYVQKNSSERLSGPFIAEDSAALLPTTSVTKA